MEDKQKQLRAFVEQLDFFGFTGEEREQYLRGWNIFFDLGWPTNCYTAGMAARAGAGLIPPPYTGLADEHHYKERMKAEPQAH